MGQWEYKIVNFNLEPSPDVDSRKIDETINQLGAEGWEMVNESYSFRKYDRFTFKRPLDQNSS